MSGFCPPMWNNLLSRSALASSDCWFTAFACGAFREESMKLAQPKAMAMVNEAAMRVFFESFIMVVFLKLK